METPTIDASAARHDRAGAPAASRDGRDNGRPDLTSNHHVAILDLRRRKRRADLQPRSDPALPPLVACHVKHGRIFCPSGQPLGGSLRMADFVIASCHQAHCEWGGIVVHVARVFRLHHPERKAPTVALGRRSKSIGTLLRRPAAIDGVAGRPTHGRHPRELRPVISGPLPNNCPYGARRGFSFFAHALADRLAAVGDPGDGQHRLVPQFPALAHHRHHAVRAGAAGDRDGQVQRAPIRRRRGPPTTRCSRSPGPWSPSSSWWRSRCRRSSSCSTSSTFRQADLTVKATGKQWYWSYSYPDNGKFEFDSLMLKDKERKRPTSRACSPSTTRWWCRSTRWCACRSSAPT